MMCALSATERFPSPLHEHGTVTSRSDVIKFPANLQNQTNITFILRIVSVVSKLLKLKFLKCFGIFHFKFNVM